MSGCSTQGVQGSKCSLDIITGAVAQPLLPDALPSPEWTNFISRNNELLLWHLSEKQGWDRAWEGRPVHMKPTRDPRRETMHANVRSSWAWSQTCLKFLLSLSSPFLVLPILLIKTDLWTPAGNTLQVRTSVQSTFQIFENFPKNMLLMDRLALFEACHILSLTAPRLHNKNHVFGVIQRVIHSCAASWYGAKN